MKITVDGYSVLSSGQAQQILRQKFIEDRTRKQSPENR